MAEFNVFILKAMGYDIHHQSGPPIVTGIGSTLDLTGGREGGREAPGHLAASLEWLTPGDATPPVDQSRPGRLLAPKNLPADTWAPIIWPFVATKSNKKNILLLLLFLLLLLADGDPPSPPPPSRALIKRRRYNTHIRVAVKLISIKRRRHGASICPGADKAKQTETRPP